MTVTRGKEHNLLGMNFVFNDNSTVSISTKEYVKECIQDSPLYIAKTAASPARKDLFYIDTETPMLQKAESEVFHSVVSKLLFVSLLGRPDILRAISFLCARVSKSAKQDQKKLQRLLEYLNRTLDLKRTGADDLSSIQTCVDASYTVYPDMKSHTGGVI
jgi:hypothetical protein